MQPALISFYRNILSPRHRYPNRNDLVRARVTLLFSLGEVIALLLMLLVVVTSPSRSSYALSVTITSVTPIVQLGVMMLIHRGHLRPAMIITFGILVVAGSVAFVNSGVASDLSLVLVPAMIYAALVWAVAGTMITGFYYLGLAILTGILQNNGNLPNALVVPANEIYIRVATNVVLLFFIGLLLSGLVGEFQRVLRSINRYALQLRVTGDIARLSATTSNLSDLSKRVARFLQERLGYVQVQIYLVDRDQRYATLVASTDETGEALIQRGYRLAVGAQGVVGQATFKGEPVSSDVNAVFADSNSGEQVSKVRHEIALPLIVEDRVTGALSLQNARISGFSPEEINNLQALATQVGVALRNAQVFDEQKTILNENRRLFLEAELNLREAEQINRRLTGEAWTEYFKTRGDDTIGYTLAENLLRQDSSWSSVLVRAASERQPVITTEGDRQIVAVPVELRGRPIGAIEVETKGSLRQADTLEMLQSISQRLALSIDNARLFEQAQELAQRELEINAISAHLQAATDLDEVIRTAVQELGRVLGAQQASVRLGVNLLANRELGRGMENSSPLLPNNVAGNGTGRQ